MPEYRIAVGIPTMDNERTIWDTLRAFAEQTRPPDAIYIVDGSSDRTLEIVARFQSTVSPPFEICAEEQRDEGVGAARNRILANSNENILAFFDTDAVPAADWVENHLQTHKCNPSIDIVSGAHDVQEQMIVESPSDRRFLIQKNCSIKRRALESVNGWDSQFNRGEDWDLALRLWKSGASSLARGDIERKPIAGDGLKGRLRLRLGRPSAIRFLRKYGWWYLRSHPTHVFGDGISILSSLALLITPPLLLLFGKSALLLLFIPLFGVTGAIAVQEHNRTGGTINYYFLKKSSMEFFILGYTAIREVIYGPRSGWNYGGLE